MVQSAKCRTHENVNPKPPFPISMVTGNDELKGKRSVTSKFARKLLLLLSVEYSHGYKMGAKCLKCY